MKRILTSILISLLALSAFTFCTGAQEAKYQPELGDGYLSFDFSQISCGTVNNVPSATLTKNVEFQGRNALKIVPNPSEGGTNMVNLDGYTIANYDHKVEVPKRLTGIGRSRAPPLRDVHPRTIANTANSITFYTIRGYRTPPKSATHLITHRL